MKKRFLALMMSLMCLLGMNAQQEIMWEDPTGQYHTETVVYATVLVNNQPSSKMLYPAIYNEGDWKIGAFVNGELRDIVEPYDYVTAPFPSGNIQQRVDAVEYTEDGSKLMAVYTFRIGGDVDLDNNANIEFKVLSGGNIYKTHLFNASVIAYNDASILNEAELYASQTGATISSELQIQWGGDVTLNQPNGMYYLVYSPASYIKSEPETIALDLHLGDPAVNLKEKFESFKYYAQDGTEVAGPIEGGYWEYDSEYLMFEGDNVSAIAKPQDGEPVIATYIGGTFIRPDGCVAEITILDPWVNVENIMVEDVTLFKGQSLLRPEVIFNNGETIPTETGYTMVSDNTDIVKIVNGALEPVGIGETTVTITSVGTNSDGNTVSHTFAVNVLSALENMTYPEDRIEYTIQEGYESMDEYVLPLEFAWTRTEDGSPVVSYEDESFTVVSADSDILEIVQEEGETGLIYRYIAVSKGQTTLTFTSIYDPSKQVVVPVYISKAVHGINIIEVNGEDPFSKPAPMVNVAIGQEVTASAQVFPEDADYTSVIFRFVDANWGILEKTEGDVVMGDVMVADGLATVTFMFNRVPEREYYLQAVVDGITSDIVKINVTQSVSDFKLFNSNGEEMADGDDMTIWYLSEEEIYTFFTEVLPEDATNKSIAVTIEPEGILSYAQGEIEGVHDFTILSKGTATITFESVDNPSVKKTITVTTKKKLAEMWLDLDEYTIYSDEVAEGRLNFWPADADINYDNFMFNVWGEQEGWEYLRIEPRFEESEVGDSGMVVPVSIEPMSLSYNLNIEISYMPEDDYVEDVPMTSIEVAVVERIGMTPGWNWISLISGTATVKQLANELVEARSQTQLVYNDPQFGLFGELDWFNSSEAYKVNIASMGADGSVIESARLIIDEPNFDPEGEVATKSLSQGWNWVGYPYEYNYLVSDVFDAAQFAEGDLILSKDSGLAALKNGVWENDFELTHNTGYMIYHNGETIEVTMPNRYNLSQPEGPRVAARNMASKAESVWSYDGSRFANTMAIIGKLEMNDVAEDYTIGAFVGDECRGEGRVVNGTAYITVAGEAGEIVSFRLYNTWTGQYVDVTTQLEFTDLAGSVKAPIALRAPIITGIDDVAMGNQSIYFNGDILILGEYNGVATIMTVDGKVVATTHESAISIEELPVGVYVVIVDSEEGRKVKKIVKN